MTFANVDPIIGRRTPVATAPGSDLMKYTKQSLIAATPERVFAFHELPDAFERLVPPWEDVLVVQKADISKVGSRAIIETRLFGLFTTSWVAEHTAYDPPRMFEDVQVSGPFASWRHRHLIEPHDQGAVLTDEIDFEPPLGFAGRFAAPLLIVPKLEKMFEYRHQVTREWAENE